MSVSQTHYLQGAHGQVCFVLLFLKLRQLEGKQRCR